MTRAITSACMCMNASVAWSAEDSNSPGSLSRLRSLHAPAGCREHERKCRWSFFYQQCHDEGSSVFCVHQHRAEEQAHHKQAQNSSLGTPTGLQDVCRNSVNLSRDARLLAPDKRGSSSWGLCKNEKNVPGEEKRPSRQRSKHWSPACLSVLKRLSVRVCDQKSSSNSPNVASWQANRAATYHWWDLTGKQPSLTSCGPMSIALDPLTLVNLIQSHRRSV